MLQALFDGFLGEQAGGDHDVGVGGVGAGGDGGDDDGAVVEVGSGSTPKRALTLDGAAAVGAGGAGGDGDVSAGCRCGCADAAGDVAVGGGVAAFALPANHLAGGGLLPLGPRSAGSCCCEAGGGLREQDAVLRALGAGDGGLDGCEVEREGGGVLGFGSVGGVEEALLADSRPRRGRCALRCGR